MAGPILPVPCPKCGERQNTLRGGFDPDREPFGRVSCMVCGHAFTAEEYRAGLALARAEDSQRRRAKIRSGGSEPQGFGPGNGPAH